MKDKDIIYLAEAASIELQKFLAIVNSTGATIGTGARAAFDLQR
jgi:hypothetical protein